MRTLNAILVPTALAALLAGCGGGDGNDSNNGAAPLTVPRVASCQTSDVPETGLQGQVPAVLRTGFKGFNCNLTLQSEVRNANGTWSAATVTDNSGRRCAYHATQDQGVPVVDVTDPTNAKQTQTLTTTAMKNPWESLRVNDRRKLLVADDGKSSNFGSAALDVYDVGTDCTNPQLLATVLVGTGLPNEPIVTSVSGHEGNFAPDGLTYYIGDIVHNQYRAIDLTDATKPRLIATFDTKSAKLGGTHGLSVSEDGTRVYAVSTSGPTLAQVVDPTTPATNGFMILDTSEVQARKAGAQIKLVSSATFRDGSVAQHTIPFKSAANPGKSFLVQVDEGGGGGINISVTSTGYTLGPLSDAVSAACSVGFAPFPMGRIYDISDELRPAPVSKLMLETHDPANCSTIIPDLTGVTIFGYGSHYCTVDSRANATAMACGYFNSGVRVFDIRDPSRPKEIAYYNPASPTGAAPDKCTARVDFDYARGLLTTMCQGTGELVLKFAPGTWPFKESTPSAEQS